MPGKELFLLWFPSSSIPFQTFLNISVPGTAGRGRYKAPTSVLDANTVLVADANFLYTGALMLGNYLVRNVSVPSLAHMF